jgi:hypothetical protein
VPAAAVARALLQKKTLELALAAVVARVQLLPISFFQWPKMLAVVCLTVIM